MPGTDYLGFAVEKANDHRLVYAEIEVLRGAFLAAGSWFDSGELGSVPVELRPGITYRILLLSNRPQSLAIPVQGPSRPLVVTTTTPIDVDSADKDTPFPSTQGSPGTRPWETTDLAGRGGSFGFAAIWAVWSTGAMFGGNACITKVRRTCPGGLVIQVASPGYGGSWRYLAPQQLPNANRQVAAILQGNAKPSLVSIFGLTAN
jgi:hypothetical protein